MSEQVYQLIDGGAPAVSVEEIKEHLKLDSCAEDELLQFWAESVTEYAEKCTGRDLRTNQWTLTLDCFSDRIVLRRDTVATIDSIDYNDEAEAPQVVPTTTYYLKRLTQTSQILLAPDEDWPTDVSDREGSIVITFTTQAAKCLDLMRAGILRQITFMFENRGDCAKGDASIAEASGAAEFYSKNTIARL